MEQQQHNKEMNLAWQFIESTEMSVFLTGKAGTGKTTFLKTLRERSPKRAVVVAPTGVAAINAQGMTIHSFFQISPGIHLPDMQVRGKQNYHRFSDEKKNIIRTMDLLIIDEISMVRADLLDAIDHVMRRYRDRYKPFGGVQLLLIGDLQQLAPVAADKEWELLKDYYETPYFFSSRALQQTPYVTIELRHIYRQSDADFIRLLANIREGRLDETTVAVLNERYVPNFTPADEDEFIRLTTHNYKAQQWNERKLAAIDEPERHFACETKGDFPENSYPADADLVLKKGAQVMFVKNDTGDRRQYYNGKIGRIHSFDNGEILVQCKDSANLIRVGMAEWANTKTIIDAESKELTEKVIGTFRQYPLRLAWSITIHKSQGLTFDHALLDINQSFAHGQVYVALSRCRSLRGIVLSAPLSIRTLQTDEQVDHYIAGELKSAEQTESKLPSFRYDFFRSLLIELFHFDNLQRSLAYVVRILQEHLPRKTTLSAPWTEAADSLNEHVVKVAAKFQEQYTLLLARSADYTHDAQLQERIAKACDYFGKQLAPLDTLLKATRTHALPGIGNKAVKKQLTGALGTFALDLQIKRQTLRLTREHGFSVHSYLADRAQATLTD